MPLCRYGSLVGVGYRLSWRELVVAGPIAVSPRPDDLRDVYPWKAL